MTSALLWLLLLSAPVPQCSTDSECAAMWGGNGDPEPVCADGRAFDERAADANRDGCTGEPWPD